jgi:hypothetical protein
MGKVTYSPGIQYVKGSLSKPKKVDGHNHGDYLIGTHREAATTNPNCTRLYIRKAETYQRSTPVTQNEQAARTRFSTVLAAVNTRAKNLSTLTTDYAAFEEQKNTAEGKKTFKAYLWAVCGAEYDAQHNG